MRPSRSRRLGVVVAIVASTVIGSSGAAQALGVGDATWTPASSETTIESSRFLKAGDAMTFRTVASWDPAQVEGLSAYLGTGLRYTHEVNDRSGRLSATGYWATNHPDPAFDRDDDDGDGRWEEAEIIAGQTPQAGRPYTTAVQLSRWHAKRQAGKCRWAWDRRRGDAVILSQLSRELLGEWQAERYTDAYGVSDYARVESREPDLGARQSARCREVLPAPGQSGVTVTFSEPVRWSDFLARPGTGSGRWTAFEAIGSSAADDLPWTCGGPVRADLGLRPCRELGVKLDGVVAAIGYFDAPALDALRAMPQVARVSELRDSLTSLLFDIGGFGVEVPGLTVDDAYWELVSPAG